MASTRALIPRPFVLRRLHSLAGIWMTLYLIFHLVTNSQAALYIGESGEGFVTEVNKIHSLPYLIFIEGFLLGVPFILHMVLGVKYLLTGESNSWGTDGTKPALAEYSRNHAYTWQRITSWVLLFAIILHVVHMRILNYPLSTFKDGEKLMMITLDADDGLFPVAARVKARLYTHEEIAALASSLPPEPQNASLLALQQWKEQKAFVEALEKRPPAHGQVVAVAEDFGTATLLMVRESFKSPVMVALYSLFVLAACFHGFNGLWTFLITWGVTLTPRSQDLSRRLATTLMILISLLGLAAVWGTYWVNLYE